VADLVPGPCTTIDVAGTPSLAQRFVGFDRMEQALEQIGLAIPGWRTDQRVGRAGGPQPFDVEEVQFELAVDKLDRHLAGPTWLIEGCYFDLVGGQQLAKLGDLSFKPTFLPGIIGQAELVLVLLEQFQGLLDVRLEVATALFTHHCLDCTASGLYAQIRNEK
jgi:hypothetical protein